MSLKKAYPMNLKNSLKKITKGTEPVRSAENQSNDKKTEASLKALDMLDQRASHRAGGIGCDWDT